MTQNFYRPFTRAEAVDLWSQLVAGWANSLNRSGNRTLMDGIRNERETSGSYEGVTRMLWGLGSWLSYPDRPATLEWRGVRYDVEKLTYQALVNGCDPNAAGSWHYEPVPRPDWDQRTVESAQVAFATWQTRDRLWARMSETERGHITGWLDLVGRKPSRWGNNWALFWVLNHTARKKLGQPHDDAINSDVLTNYMDGVYCGDGWYDDGDVKGNNYFDNYITWVFGMHVMAWSEMDGDSLPERRDELLHRVEAWMNHYPYFFAGDGATVEYGRSLAYKFCRLGAPLWAYKLGLWKHPVGMLKRLVAKHLRWYVDRGAVRADGTLRQEVTSTGSPEVIERYISTGATYWAIQAFSGLWALPDDDPFWTAEEEPLPAEQSDFVKVFAQPGWVLSAKDGHVQQFNAGSVHPGYGNKYAKLVYSSRSPFNIGLDAGQPSLDSQLCLSENGLRAQREGVIAYAAAETWLRTRYAIEVNGHRHLVDTTLIPLGNVHIRAHQITLDPKAQQVTAEEGSAPLGYDPGAIPTLRMENGWAFAEYARNGVGLRAIAGYAAAPKITAGSPNLAYGFNLLPTLTTPVRAHHNLICAVYEGAPADLAQLPTIERVHWEPDGRFIAHVNGTAIEVPGL